MPPIRQINVFSDPGSQPLAELAPLLENLFPVKFVFCAMRTNEGDGELIIGDGSKWATAGDANNLSSLHVPPPAIGSQEAVEMTIRFADDVDVPFPFRSRSIRVKTCASVKALAACGKEKVLAKSEQGPLWTVSKEQGTKRFKSSFALPNLPRNGKLNDVLNGNAFIEMVFLIQWLRELCASGFNGPPLRAAYIIDDPNLHWPTYGHVNYEQMAEHASREKYHISFATVPLDTWFTHARVANLFKQRARQLSLSIHGNDHIREELAQPYSKQQRIALLQQAISRVERLERRTGLRVCRVMVPPHGACSEEMLGAIATNGFEAASISHGSLRVYNESKPWTKTLGCRPCEMVNGCTVMPRWSLTVDNNAILLAAYLDQTIILRGHQNDLKEGLGILDRQAQFINSLGNITWGALSDLSRMNYRWRMEGNICRVKPMSPKISFPLPKGIAGLMLDNSANEDWAVWRVCDAKGAVIEIRSGEVVPVPGGFQGTALMEATSPATTGAVAYRRRSAPRAIVRRLLTESRDRVMLWR